MKYFRLHEVAERYGIAVADLEAFAAEGLIEIKQTADEDRVISADDADNARVARLLVDELDVNLAGVEVIVRMRAEMIAMQRQFGKILETLIEEIRQVVAR
jgi:MerR family transcriptional regulator/heat shock protein HspR